MKGILEAVLQEEMLCDEVIEFTYLGDRVSAVGGCRSAVTARTICGWIKFSVQCVVVWLEISFKAERSCL